MNVSSSRPTASTFPPAPTARPTTPSPIGLLKMDACRTIGITGCMDTMVPLPSQLNCLNNVSREKQLERPRHQDADLPFKARELREIDPSPHEPGEQS